MKMSSIALIVGLAGLSAFAGSAAAQSMYRWTDERGGIQFGQQPPADRPYQRVDIKASQPPGGVLREREPLSQQPPTPTAQDDAASNHAQASREQQAEVCKQLRANLSTLENNPRLSRTNAQGEVERIGEDERQALITQTQEELNTDCN